MLLSFDLEAPASSFEFSVKTRTLVPMNKSKRKENRGATLLYSPIKEPMLIICQNKATEKYKNYYNRC